MTFRNEFHLVKTLIFVFIFLVNNIDDVVVFQNPMSSAELFVPCGGRPEAVNLQAN